MNLDGAHGTCKSAAETILSSGFDCNKAGDMVGQGAYFWLGTYRETLAKEWYNKRLNEGKYDSFADKSKAIITVLINCDDKNVLNLDGPEVLLAFEKLYYKSQRPKDKGRAVKILLATISTLERQFKTQYKVLLVRLPVPDKSNTKYPIGHIGWPLCAVARHKDCLVNIVVK